MLLRPKYLLYSTEVLPDIYQEYAQQIQGFYGECIVKIMRGIVELVLGQIVQISGGLT